MTDIPILFSGPMVRALLDGRKTQTRRALKPLPRRTIFFDERTAGSEQFRAPAYRSGDRLWVREAFSYDRLDVDRDGTLPPWYWADGNPDAGDWTRPKPSIHMPRWASRLTLHVTDVRVQRLQDISEADAVAEGVEPRQIVSIPDHGGEPETWWFGAGNGRATAKSAYRDLWDSLNAKRGFGWDTNPWVAAISFDVHRGNIDQL